MKENQTVLITGCASGIGNSTVKKYLEAGFNVIGIDKNECFFDGNFRLYLCDLSNESDVKRIFASIKSNYNSINYLINCAGILFNMHRDTVDKMDIVEWCNMMHNNLTSSMLITREAIPVLKKSTNDKAIVFVSSDQAFYPKNKSSAYATSKGGLVTFSKSCAVELLEYSIRVNTVAPASVKTNFIKKLADNSEKMDALYQKENDKMPLGIITPEEVSELIFFLGSPKSKKITGQTIMIDSGLYL